MSSELQIPPKGPRKRRSTTAIRESEESQKRVALERDGEEADIDKAMAEVTEAMEAARIAERQAKEDGRRVEKKPRKVRRLRCCACGDRSGASRNGACSGCGHVRCAECMLLGSVPDAS